MDNFDNGGNDHDMGDEEDRFVNKDDHHIGILELEGGDSLFRQSALLSRSSLKLRLPKKARNGTTLTNHPTTVMGFLRHRIQGRFTSHSMAFIAFLGLLLLLPLLWENRKLQQADPAEQRSKPPHTSGLGGSLNTGHATNDNNVPAYSQEETMETFPKSNSGIAVVSLSETNRWNYQGHFWHDPYVSPYASRLYASENENDDDSAQLQHEFDQTRTQVMQTFGAFDPPIAENIYRYPYDHIPYRDVTTFAPDAWQLNPPYVTDFLDEALALVRRVQEGIYQEYGLVWPAETAEQSAMKTKRQEFFPIIQQDFQVINGTAYSAKDDKKQKLRGVGYMTPSAWEGLVRKLWHTLLTHNEFYAVVVGPASTFRGNNFGESQIMQFNDIMEPVLDKLGVRLISRNMGMDASTTVSALGGAAIYGEADILWYIPDTRPGVLQETAGQLDLLYKQAILSGERMPLILTPFPGNLWDDTKGKAWIGNIQPGAEICEFTTLRSDNSIVLPDVEACQYLRCSSTAASQQVCDKYHSQCWVPRNSNVWNPPVGEQKEADGYQASGYPNYPQHRWEGRKLSMIVLKALEEAILRWQKQTVANVLPPPVDLWHMQPVYEEIRESVRTLERTPGKSQTVPACETLLLHLNPMICHLSMSAYTEWTPRVNPTFHRLSNITSTPIADNRAKLDSLYDTVDLRPRQWRLPAEAVDVHMIALATNSSVNEDTRAEDFFPVFKEDPPTYFAENSEDYEWRDTVTHDDSMSDDDEMPSPNIGGGNPHSAKIASHSWTVYEAPIGFCDGSAQSRCNRAMDNTCLLANQNHYKAAIVGHGNGGWLDVTLPVVREGIILIRFDWQLNEKIQLTTLPSDFVFSFEVTGPLTTLSRGHWSRDEFIQNAVTIAPDLTVHTLLMEERLAHTLGASATDVHVSLKLESVSKPQETILYLTHMYYA